MKKWIAMGLLATCLVLTSASGAGAAPHPETDAPAAAPELPRADSPTSSATEHTLAPPPAQVTTTCGLTSEAAHLGLPTSVVDTAVISSCPADGKICIATEICQAECRLCGIQLAACVWGICRCLDT